jgi:hypothetical protein
MSITIPNACCAGKEIQHVILYGLVWYGEAGILSGTDCTSLSLGRGSTGFAYDSGGGFDDDGNELPTIPLGSVSVDNCSQMSFSINFLGQSSPYYGIGSGGPVIYLGSVAYDYSFNGSFDPQLVCVARAQGQVYARFKMGDSYSVHCEGGYDPILYPPYDFVVNNPTLSVYILYNV